MLKLGKTTDNTEKGWRYISSDHMVVIPSKLMNTEDISFLPPEIQEKFSWSKYDIFRLLHEMGHAQHRHRSEKNSMLRYIHEKQAWQYACDCLKPEFHSELWKFAKIRLQTYMED